MYEGKSHTLFAKYAVPQMIGLLFNSVYMIVDGVFIGNRLGRDAMAAAAVSVPLVEILIALSMAVATGAGVLISSHLGQGEKEKARHIFSLAALCTAVMGLLISVLGNIFIHPLAELLGSTPVIHDEAISYMWYIMPTTFTVRGETVIVESEQLAAALLRLPEKRREVLFLRYYLGYSDTEIGRLFGVCRSTIFRRRKRSLRFIRKELEALEDEE